MLTPDHSILGEETGELAGKNSGADYQWIIDPLDGTTNFLHGFPQFAVSIGVKYKGRLEHAVIYDPHPSGAGLQPLVVLAPN